MAKLIIPGIILSSLLYDMSVTPGDLVIDLLISIQYQT